MGLEIVDCDDWVHIYSYGTRIYEGHPPTFRELIAIFKDNDLLKSREVTRYYEPGGKDPNDFPDILFTDLRKELEANG